MRRRRTSSTPAFDLEVTLDLPRRGAKTSARSTATETVARTPRVTRLMALAVKYQEEIDRGELRDYADIARLGHVTRARVTQIMNLSNLAPDIVDEILFPTRRLPPERGLRSLAAEVEWPAQRRLWRVLRHAGVGSGDLPL